MQCPSCDHEIADGSQFCGFCGARLQERNETSPQLSADFDESIDTEERQESSYVGQIIDRRYQVLSMIARGGMGTVYKVVHIHMRKVLAMKLLHEHILARRKLVQRFTREARAISRLSNPHTVRVYDFGQWREVFNLAMEYHDGQDLYGVLAREGPLGVLRTVSILDQICSSLEEAHDSGIIHRDLKTENIMVLKDVDGHDFVKVLDFGLAKVMDAEERITAQSQPDLFGTPYYMAPEQIRGLTADTRVDIYALGCLAFRMLAGTFPYAAASAFETLRSHLNDPIPSVRARAPELGVPLWLDQVVQACLAKHPDGRYGSVAELRDGLRKGVESSVMGSVPEVSRGRRRRPTIPSVLPAADGGASKPPGEISTDRYADHRPYDPHQTMMELRAFKSSHRRRKIFAAVALAASIAIGGFMAWERYAPEHRSRGNEGEPNDEEIANALDLSITEVRDTLRSGCRAVSLDRAVSDDEDSTLLKRLADPDQKQPDDAISRSSSQKRLETALEVLDDREHEIVQLYFGLDGSEPMTLEQIGHRMGVTRERIRQLKVRALSRLRHPLRREVLLSLEEG